jgi:hypothetical protein
MTEPKRDVQAASDSTPAESPDPAGVSALLRELVRSADEIVALAGDGELDEAMKRMEARNATFELVREAVERMRRPVPQSSGAQTSPSSGARPSPAEGAPSQAGEDAAAPSSGDQAVTALDDEVVSLLAEAGVAHYRLSAAMAAARENLRRDMAEASRGTSGDPYGRAPTAAEVYERASNPAPERRIDKRR